MDFKENHLLEKTPRWLSPKAILELFFLLYFEVFFHLMENMSFFPPSYVTDSQDHFFLWELDYL